MVGLGAMEEGQFGPVPSGLAPPCHRHHRRSLEELSPLGSSVHPPEPPAGAHFHQTKVFGLGLRPFARV